MYHNRFSGSGGLEQMLEFATEEAARDQLLAQTLEWQAPILQSTMPLFLQFKLINSA